MQVTNALTRQRKEEVVEVLKGKLDNSVIVFGFRFNKLNVSDPAMAYAWFIAYWPMLHSSGLVRAAHAPTF